LKEYVAQIMEETGIKIEYGCESLHRDDWIVDILPQNM
jgi:hypothetical protein